MENLLLGKIAIVTGASSGIGKVTALELAKSGALVVMVCRPGAKAESAFRELCSEAGQDKVDLMFADLSSQDSIRAFAKEFMILHDRLDILINNAGLFISKKEQTTDGFERTFATNHLAPFLLTALLLDLLKASAPSRIINVASAAHRFGTMDFNDLQSDKHYSGMKAYSQSKLATVLFTYELSRKLRGTNVTANCLHPGVVNTGWGRSEKGLFKLGMDIITPFMLSPEKGAKTSIYLASSPEVEGITGKYFSKCKQVASSKESYDEKIAQRLWEMSEKLTCLA